MDELLSIKKLNFSQRALLRSEAIHRVVAIDAPRLACRIGKEVRT